MRQFILKRIIIFIICIGSNVGIAMDNQNDTISFDFGTFNLPSDCLISIVNSCDDFAIDGIERKLTKDTYGLDGDFIDRYIDSEQKNSDFGEKIQQIEKIEYDKAKYFLEKIYKTEPESGPIEVLSTWQRRLTDQSLSKVI